MTNQQSGNNQSFSGLSASNGGNLIAGSVRDVNIHTSNSSNDVLDVLPNAVNARFNAYQRQHDLTCLENTRVDILREIYTWADGQDERYIFWLNGLAGTGKSTIARTIARRYFEQKRLGASFFFTRKGGGDVGHAEKFVTSIALQLASSVPSLDQHIRDAIRERRDIATQSLRDQWQQLVVNPLSKLRRSGSLLSKLKGSCGLFPYILVIDALDECNDERDIRIIVHLLTAESLKAAHLRVFLTSRAEDPIRTGFSRVPDCLHRDFALHDIPSSVVDRDIHLFLQRNFKLIELDRSLSPDWPGPKITEQFVRNAGSLFIWAATACRYIEKSPYADEGLQDLLDGSTYASSPEEHLNDLYTSVLRGCVHPNYSAMQRERLCERLRIILGSIVVLSAPLPVSSLQRLLCLSPEMIDPTLQDLHAILDIPNAENHPIRLHHPSFGDFLLDHTRCTDPKFLVDKARAHKHLADRCIQLMQISLKQDICGLNTPGMLVADADRSLIEQSLPPDAQYACCYWMDHVQGSGTPICDNDELHVFLQTHLLHWLEALGWLGKLSVGIHAMVALESFLSSDDSPALWTFVHDAKRFVLYNRAAIEQAPLQAYMSALVFAPKSSIVRRIFASCTSHYFQKLPSMEPEWSALLQVLDSNTETVNAVTFSPDGKMLASPSKDKTVKVWDAASGALLQTLVGHEATIKYCFFLPNSTSLVSTAGTRDHTARVWNSITGQLLLVLNGGAKDEDRDIYEQLLKPSRKGLNSDVPLFAEYMHLFAPYRRLFATYMHLFAPYRRLFATYMHLFDPYRLLFATYMQLFAPYRLLFAACMYLFALYSYKPLFAAGIYLFVAYKFSIDSGTRPSIPYTQLTDSDTQLSDSDIRLSDLNKLSFSQCFPWHYRVGSDGFLSTKSDGWMLFVSVAKKQFTLVRHDYEEEISRLKDDLWTEVEALIWSLDGEILAFASGEEIKLHDRSGAEVGRLKCPWDHIEAMVFSKDNELLALSSGTSLYIWEFGTGILIRKFDWIQANSVASATSLNGTLQADVLESTIIRVSSVIGGNTFRSLEGHSGRVTAVDFSPDARLLASASTDGTVRLWDTSIKPGLPSLDAHWDYITSLSFSPDGKFLASSANDCAVTMWDVENQVIRRNFAATHVSLISFSPDNKLIALLSNDCKVSLRRVAEGGAEVKIIGDWSCITTMAFSPDSKILATASGRKVRLWDTAVGIEQIAHPDHHRVGNFSPDNKTFYLDSISSNTQKALPPSVSIEDHWVLHRNKRLLWLPPDHRPSVSAFHGETAAFGFKSGRVTIIQFVP